MAASSSDGARELPFPHVWSVRGDQGTWQRMSTADSAKLEKAFSSDPRGRVNLQLGCLSLVSRFRDAGHQASLEHLPYPFMCMPYPFMCTAEQADGYPDVVMKAAGGHVKIPNGEAVNVVGEATAADFHVEWNGRKGCVKKNNLKAAAEDFEYEVVFSGMQQVNSKTGEVWGLRRSPVAELWHGTTLSALSRLRTCDVRPSQSGCFGPGFYLTSQKEKAIAWAKRRAQKAKDQPVIVLFSVHLENCKVYDVKECGDFDYFPTKESKHANGRWYFHDYHGVADVELYGKPEADQFGRTAASLEVECPCRSWMREGYEAQYVLATSNPHLPKEQAELCNGDEIVLHPWTAYYANLQYLDHEICGAVVLGEGQKSRIATWTYWDDDQEEWFPYSVEDDNEMEAAYASDRQRLHHLILGPNSFEYSVCFKGMNQRNSRTGKLRKICRKADVPGPYDDFSDPQCLIRFARDAHIRFLRADYLLRLAREKGRLPRHQEAPPEAFYTHGQLEEFFARGEDMCPLVVSYPWLAPHHPDRDGQHLFEISHFLGESSKIACDWTKDVVWKSDKEKRINNRIALFEGCFFVLPVFIDFPCLPQQVKVLDDSKDGWSVVKDRTPAENKYFFRGLNHMGVMYRHDRSRVLQLSGEVPGDAINPVAYHKRGWCNFEAFVSRMKAEAHFKGTPLCFEMPSVRVAGLQMAGSMLNRAPTPPIEFQKILKHVHFTNGHTDREVVSKLYADIFDLTTRQVKKLAFQNLEEQELHRLASLLHCFRCPELELHTDAFFEFPTMVSCTVTRNCSRYLYSRILLNSLGRDNASYMRWVHSALLYNWLGESESDLERKHYYTQQDVQKHTVNLTHLYFENDLCDARPAWQHLAKLQNLTHLEISTGNDLGPEGAQHLAKLQNLTHLKIGNHDNNLGPEGAQHLAKLQHLTHLKIGDYNNLGPDGAQHLAKLQNLTHLEIGEYNNLGPEGAQHLAKLRNLTHLKIGNGNNLGPEGAQHLAKLKNLTHLQIGYNNLGPEGAQHLAKLQNLTQLEFGVGNNLGPDGAQHLAKLRNLTHLEIGDRNNLGPAWQHLAKLQNLTHLEISCGNNLGPEGAQHLAKLRNLTHLKIGNDNNLGPEGTQHLAKLQNLTHLEIGGKNNLGPEGAQHLAKLKNLTHLKIGNRNNLGPEGAQHLAKLQNLTHLKIGD